MIQLGSLALNDGLVWVDEYAYTGIVQEVKTTLGGTPLVYTSAIKGPMLITLKSAGEDQGWQTLAQVQALRAMALVKDGLYTLQLDARSFSVRFRHDDPPVLEASPLIYRTTQEAGDYFVVSIKLAVDNVT